MNFELGQEGEWDLERWGKVVENWLSCYGGQSQYVQGGIYGLVCLVGDRRKVVGVKVEVRI